MGYVAFGTRVDTAMQDWVQIMKTTLDAVEEGLVVTSPDRVVLHANRSAESAGVAVGSRLDPSLTATEAASAGPQARIFRLGGGST